MGDSVVVQGAGGLGISAAASAKDRGASQVIVIDGQAGRLELARQSGADETIDLNEYDTAEARIERVKGPHRRTGRGHRDGGRRLPAGDQRGDRHGAARRGVRPRSATSGPNSMVTLDMAKVLWGQVRIIPVTHYHPSTLPVALDFLARTKDRFPLTNVMSHRLLAGGISGRRSSSANGWARKRARLSRGRSLRRSEV